MQFLVKWGNNQNCKVDFKARNIVVYGLYDVAKTFCSSVFRVIFPVETSLLTGPPNLDYVLFSMAHRLIPYSASSQLGQMHSANITHLPTIAFFEAILGVESQVIQPIFENVVPPHDEEGIAQRKMVGVIWVVMDWGNYFQVRI